MKFFKYLILLGFIILISKACEDRRTSEENSSKNRLAVANSPYLVQHADNPVNWYEWGPEALEKAEREDKLILISVGYAACHWCHVMEEESFMDPGVAEIMNTHFVSIKIDREERPDIDKIYMNAAQLLNGSGGWPLNVVALPNGKPFFAGTYFQNEEWQEILNKIATAYKEDKGRLIQIANELTEGIKNVNSLDSLVNRKVDFSRADYQSIYSNWQKNFDQRHGGYTSAQKFPLPVTWEALLQYYYLTEDEEALKDVTRTLDKMARGGIYDQLGGGFSRYTTDPAWFIPHFEKMLYDNAQLISLYSKAYKITKNKEYRQVVEQSLEFVERELSNSEGGYYSSVNADSEGEEGKYYVWTYEEIKNLLSSSESALIFKYYNIEQAGNWEGGNNILFRSGSKSDFIDQNKLLPEKVETLLAEANKKLLNRRQQRIKPSIDNKSLTSWNALMVEAYLDAYLAFGKPVYLQKAKDGANFLNEKMVKSDFSLWRNYRDGNTGVNGFLDDYVFLSKAYLRLYQITFEKKWLDKAKNITNYAVQNFQDDQSGMFFYTANDHQELVAKNLDLDDNVIPSSNSVMAHNLFILGTLLEEESYLEISRNMLYQMREKALEEPAYYANWTKLFGIEALGAYEIAIVGDSSREKNKQLQSNYLPTAVFMGGEKEDLPLLKGKLLKNQTLVYVCQNKTCKYPVAQVEQAIEIIEEYRTGSELRNQTWLQFGNGKEGI